MQLHPSASFSFTLRVEIDNQPGMLGRLTTCIGEQGGDIGAIDIVRVERGVMVRDITINAANADHARAIVDAVRCLAGFKVVNVSDRTFLIHLGGKLGIQSRVPLKTRDDLSMAYTPGVARVCRAIAADPSAVYTLTIKRHAVAVVTDGSAILGLGNLGPAAALPVMEGKAILFKEFGGVDAWPICLDTQDPDAIVETVRLIAPGFGGINLEDISAPRCFDIEARLKAALDIPVFHDDQHGTAVVVLAALHNALTIVGKTIDQVAIVVNGAGAAGVAVTRMLLAAGARAITVCDTHGIIAPDRAGGLTPIKQWLAEHTTPARRHGTLHDALPGADVFIGVSAPNVIGPDDVRAMAADPIVFALANPDPEVEPEAIAGLARVIATGRSDYPNQINNVLCFPGLFRGALDCRAREITAAMTMAAARAIAGCIAPDELHEDYIVPSVFNRRVAEAVARAVAAAAQADGVARREHDGQILTSPAAI
jgi:malate dehydrogenase (oxaloacetate-decarboxylating)